MFYFIVYFQYSLVVNILIVFLGALCFFLTALYIVSDKRTVERYVEGKTRNLFLVLVLGFPNLCTVSLLYNVVLFAMNFQNQEIMKFIRKCWEAKPTL